MTKNSQSSQGKNPITNKRNPIRISKVMRYCKKIFKILKDTNHQPRVAYAAKLSFQCEGEIKAFTDKENMREFTTGRPSLQEMLKGALLPETRRQKYTEH